MAVMTPRQLATAVEKLIKKKIEPVYARSRLLALAKAHGLITWNHQAKEIEWRVRFERRTPQPLYGPVVSLPFEAPVRYKTAKLPWRMLGMGEMILDTEKVLEGPDSVFPKQLDDIIKSCVNDFEYAISAALYQDGDASEGNIHGLESMFAISGLRAGGEPVGDPNDVYAGLSTALGAYGGTISGAWPVGTCDAKYCFFSPLVVAYNSTRFNEDDTTWPATWQGAIGYATTWINSKQSEQPDIILMHPEMLRQAKASLKDAQRLEVTAKSPLVDLGIRTLNYDGVELLDDPHCPQDTVYLLSTRRMELLTPFPKGDKESTGTLIKVHESTDPYNNDLYYFRTIFNLRFDSPAFFGKITSIS